MIKKSISTVEKWLYTLIFILGIAFLYTHFHRINDTPQNNISFPPLTGQVVDTGNFISATANKKITQTLQQDTENQIIIAILSTLNGYDINDYGVRLARHWGVGDKTKNNGVLITLAPNENQIRIDVGYGLEGVLTDAQSFQLIQKIKPLLAQNDIENALLLLANDVVSMLNPDLGIVISPAPTITHKSHNNGGILILLGIFALGVFIFVPKGQRLPFILNILYIIASLFSRGRGGGGGGFSGGGGGGFGGGGASSKY